MSTASIISCRTTEAPVEGRSRSLTTARRKPWRMTTSRLKTTHWSRPTSREPLRQRPMTTVFLPMISPTGIHWGDRRGAGGTIGWNSGSNSLTIIANHTYADNGTYAISTRITGTNGGATTTTTGTATVSNAAPTATLADVSTNEGSPATISF